jgi:hypothetical protein
LTLTPVDPTIKAARSMRRWNRAPASLHLIVADGEGAEAVTDMLAKANDPGMLAAAHVMYCPGPTAPT